MPTVSLQLCLVGLVAGFIAACVIIVFRSLLHLWHQFMLGEMGDYQALEPIVRLFLPVCAVILVLGVALLTGFKHYRLGIPFVIHRLKLYYGHIPFRSSINQFFGGILALGSGFVVGKEGPTVHLAAAAGHYIGRWMRLPFNSLRIIAGCGVAAGIAAAFNTPFAAVIFVMEVVLRDYKVHVFLPVMLAAACGSVLTRSVYGDVYALSFLTFEPVTGWELLFLVAFGFIVGCVASLFNYQLMFLMRLFRPVNMVFRLLLAAALTGIVGYIFPQALGGDFVNIAPLFESELVFEGLLALFAAKLILASVAIALGVPGGIIGAVMIIGMLLGLVLVTPLSAMTYTSSPTTYAVLGLAGLLASVLFAPMAALSAAMELAADSRVVLPAIIVIVTACITSKQLFKNSSIFIQQLDFQGLPYTTSAVRDWLQQTGVLSLINEKFTLTINQSSEALVELLSNEHDKLLIHQHYPTDGGDTKYEWVRISVNRSDDDTVLDKQPVFILTQQHTLADVHDALHKRRQGAVVIIDQLLDKDKLFVSINEVNEQTHHVQNLNKCLIRGVITWNMLNGYLLKRQHTM